MNAILLSCVLIQPVTSGAVEQRVDVLWVEHLHSEAGDRIFSQLIFLDEPEVIPGNYLSPEVVSWRIVNRQELVPVRDHRRGGYYVLFHDGCVLRLVRARSFRESWSQTDSELEARERLPQCQRRGLGP